MHNLNNQPEITMSQDSIPEVVQCMGDFETKVRSNPEATIEALGVVSLDRTTVLSTLTPTDQHPEGGAHHDRGAGHGELIGSPRLDR